MALTPDEEKILESIKVASENDPNNPEYPPWQPKWPSTPTYQIDVPGFTNVWLKDESHNPTGTHKDRMAWEMVVTYRDFLLAKQNSQISELPHLSIITSGSAGIAIQTMLKKYELPALKCLIDAGLDEKIKASLQKIGCELYETALAKKPFTWQEILALTHNENGFDITSSEALDPTTRFYDWLSYDIINQSADYCFIPFGTGNLYENVLNISKREVSTADHDPRFRGDVETLRKCNFVGATSNNPGTTADKLYSPHLPFVHYDEQWIRFYRHAAFCGPESDVRLLQEEYLPKAKEIAGANSVDCEPSGIAGLAMMLQMQESLPKDKKMLVVNTGKTKYP
ncbi:pyridoxal-phosphate dependent enzyme [archaeon]